MIAGRGGLSGRYRVTVSWVGVPRDAPRGAVLAAARRAVEDPRAAAYVDAVGGPNALQAVQLLNLAAVPVAQVADPRRRPELCTGRDPYPSGRRTATVPPGADQAERATAVATALLATLERMPREFDRARLNRALLERLGGC